MLWREGYSTRVVREYVPTGTVEGKSLCGGPFDLRDWKVCLIGCGAASLVKLEIWWKLLASDFGNGFAVAHLIQAPGPQELMESLVQPSRWGQTFLLTSDVTESFPDGAAWCPQSRLLMIGPPTENAWEEFSDSLRVSVAAAEMLFD